MSRKIKGDDKMARIRARLDYKLGRPLSDREWEHIERKLLDRDEVQTEGDEKYKEEIASIARLVKENRYTWDTQAPRYEELASRLAPSTPATLRDYIGARSLEDLSQRDRAVSILLAREAASEPGVIGFRTSVLHGQLLEYDEVTGWIISQAQAEGIVLADEPDDGELDPDPADGDAEWVVRIESSDPTLLYFQKPGEIQDLPVHTVAGGILDRLRDVSQFLSARYRFDQAQATVFVLTGRTPVVPSFSATRVIARSPTVTERLILRVDPTLPPEEVASHYRPLRRRTRRLSDKHTELAIYSANLQSSMSWNEIQSAWNRHVLQENKGEEWKYKGENSNFRRDAIRAQKRLLNPS